MSYLRCLGLIEAIKFLFKIGKIDTHFFSLMNSFQKNLEQIDQKNLKEAERLRLQKTILSYSQIQSITTLGTHKKESELQAPTLPTSIPFVKSYGY